MIRINLLSFRAARRKENTRQRLTVFALSFILVSIILLWYHSSLTSDLEELDKLITDAKNELVKYNKINAEIAVIRKKLSDLNRKIDVIKTLELGREGPARLLDAMTQVVIPKRMWFSRLEEKAVSQGSKSTSVVIDGIALDNKTVADFMKELELSGLFSSVKLITLKQDRKGSDLSLKSFTIRCAKAPLKTTTKAGKTNKAGKK
jgi:type IV pilus assembly protein PilN